MALIVLSVGLLLAPLVTAQYGFRGFVAIYIAAALAWLPLVRVRVPLGYAIAIAVALRVIFVFPEPRLSGDVYRYLSDGRVTASGGNPYAYTPSDPRINHPEIRSIYPPLAQGVFALVHELVPWRLLIIAIDVGCVVLLRRRGALAYATCPLVILEGTWSGHIDVIAGVLLGVAVARSSIVALGLAAGLKIIPLAAVWSAAAWPPLSSRRQGRRQPRLRRGFGKRWLCHRTPKLALILLLPFLPFLGGPIMPGFRDYATRWIFASPLYEGVRAVVELIPTKEIWTHHPLRVPLISDFVYRHVYADFLTRAVLGILALGGIALARKATTAVAWLLVCSPAIHPWYWLTLVPSALLERSRWLYVALIAPVTYLLYVSAP